MIPELQTIPADDVEDYRLLEILSPDRTFLCANVSDNVVVLKRLDADCLPGQNLHPQIRDRLARVREVPHPRIATLRTVERWQGSVCLVWTYVDGETFENLKPLSIPLLAALAATVDALHQAGIVHGNIHGRNVIVRPDGHVWLTDVSPYLYDDPAVDVAAVEQLISTAAIQLPVDQSAAVQSMLGKGLGLKELSHALTAIETLNITESVVAPTVTKPRFRLISLLSAGAVAAAGIGCWLVIHVKFSKTISATPTTFPSLRSDARR